MKRFVVVLIIAMILASCSSSKAPPELRTPDEIRASGRDVFVVETPADKSLPNKGLTPEEFLDSGFHTIFDKKGLALMSIPNKTSGTIIGFAVTITSDEFEKGIIILHLDGEIAPGELGSASVEDIPTPKEAKITHILMIVDGRSYEKEFQ